MSKRVSGFTIVELLIVIVIIAILAAITIVAYNGIQQRANNTARMTVGDQWAQLFRVYKATNDSYPSSMVVGTRMCLGTGFPIGGGSVPRCQNVTGTDGNSPAESASTSLLAELATVGSLPSTPPVKTYVTGPYVNVSSATSISVSVWQDGSFSVGDDCGGGFKATYASSSGAVCSKTP